MKRALITGVNGQDGSYLAELLLEKGYDVHGTIRRSSSFNSRRIEHFREHPNFKRHYMDLTDAGNVSHIISELKPDEIYNLGAQSHVKISFDIPNYTGQVDAMGTLNVLEAIRSHSPNSKLYQASTSELYGKVQETPQKETTPFYPRSPYGVAKLYGYWIVKNYRESYDLFACNGILFNHTSPRRGENFVEKKIVDSLCQIKKGKADILTLGNLSARRDIGHAKEYVEGMWRMLQLESPEDFVLATGKTYSIKEMVDMVCEKLDIDIDWKGVAEREIGIDKSSGKIIIGIDPKYYRPAEVELLQGDASKAKNILGWEPNLSLSEIFDEMIAESLKNY
jgi:GDPmannose 4,6-dehydratase